jgi:hypothetical protein
MLRLPRRRARAPKRYPESVSPSTSWAACWTTTGGKSASVQRDTGSSPDVDGGIASTWHLTLACVSHLVDGTGDDVKWL